MLRTCEVRFDAIEFTDSVRSFHVPANALHVGLAAELSFRSHFARHARHFRSERPELVDHRVDRRLQLEDLALDVDGDLLREVAGGDRLRHVGNVAHLRGEVARHRVDRVRQVLPRPRDAFDARLAAERSFGADLAGDAGHFRRERAQLVDHRVDGVLQRQELALDVDVDLLREVALGDRGRHVGDVADLVGQVAGHRVDRVGQVLPGPGDSFDLGLAAELALGADLARDPRHLGREVAELLDHLVDRLRGAQELALERPALDLERHALREVALRDRADHARDLAGRVDEVVDQRVDALDRLAPEAARLA
jgi:hypothetical protein